MSYPQKEVLAEDVSAFAAKVTPANARWEYALRTARYVFVDAQGRQWDGCFYEKSLPTLARFLGGFTTPSSLRYRLAQIRDRGSVDAARNAYFGDGKRDGWPDPFRVGTIEPWQIGHVYFARIVGSPHIVKVGFSRRVRERIDDLEAKNRVRLDVFATRVGTMADEQWWHRNWRNLQISGEWFFAPKSTDRTLPAFLATERMAA